MNQIFRDNGVTQYTLEKGWECKNGLYFINPKGQPSCDCNFCEECTAQKGIIFEDANSCIFLTEEDIKKVLS